MFVLMMADSNSSNETCRRVPKNHPQSAVQPEYSIRPAWIEASASSRTWTVLCWTNDKNSDYYNEPFATRRDLCIQNEISALLIFTIFFRMRCLKFSKTSPSPFSSSFLHLRNVHNSSQTALEKCRCVQKTNVTFRLHRWWPRPNDSVPRSFPR